MAELTGIAAVLDEALAGERPETDAEQFELLGMRTPRRSAGRPPGRINKRTQRTAELIMRAAGDPLLELARMAMLPVDGLAETLGCNRLEAFGEKRQCLIALLPYTHSRQPLAVKLGVELPMLVMADPRDFAPPSEVAGEIVEIQSVNEGGNGQV